MTLEQLEADINDARKNRDAKRLNVLILLRSKVQRIAKDDGNRNANNDDLIQAVSRYRKEVEEMRAALTTAGRPTDEQDYELEVVTAYLPAQLSDDALDAEIEKALAGTDRTRKAMGIVMKHLNGNFKGQFDPKKANALLSVKLS